MTHPGWCVAIVAISLCGASAFPAGAQDAATLERQVDSLFARHSTGQQPGLAVAVVRNDSLVFRKGYGYADLEHRVPITTSSMFDAASVSKQFTGLAVSMLIEQGKIRLDDDIRKYIPEMHAFDPPITIAHLLHHTSGLRDWPGALTLAGWNQGDVIAFEHILRFAYNQRTLNFAPGAEHTYSNTNYNLLAEIVARVTGKSFRAWTDENIFQPLGMTNTHFRTQLGDVLPNRAWSYARGADNSWNLVANGLLAQGSSSLFTTADDLARWIVNFGSYAVGGRTAVERMLSPGRLNDGSPVKYGFGVLVDTWRGIPMITHNGSWAGYTSFTVYFPKQHGGVVVLSNAGTSPDAAGIALSNLFFASHLQPETATNAGSTAAEVAVPTATLDEYTGVYKLGPGWFARVRRDGTTLRVRATQEDEFPMSARSEREFWIDAYRASMTFQRDSARRITGILYRGKSAPRVSDNVRAPVLSDYPGDYESTELAVIYSVALRDGELRISNFRRGGGRLTHVMGDDFRSPQLVVTFERDAGGRVTGFLANLGDRNRNLKFVRRPSS
jgi:CubicO group peptidase (beta-lactamase class C family)